MSADLERVYTINLGKVLLSQSQHRAVRAINMIKEFARHHMKVEDIKIEEELAHQVWARGIRRPPRKIRVRMSKTDEGYVLVSQYDEEIEEKVTPKKETKEIENKVEEPKDEEAPKVEAEEETKTDDEPEAPKVEEAKEEEEPKEEEAPKVEAEEETKTDDSSETPKVEAEPETKEETTTEASGDKDDSENKDNKKKEESK